MYEAFYGLTEAPFRLTPDPHYLYLSTHHREALGHLLFGIREGTGFVAVTGEIGTGKTTLLRALLRDLEDDTVVGYIFNPALSDVELLQTINGEFSLGSISTSKKELVDELNRYLVAQKLAGKRVVVIVDEAQNLLPGTLEQLRLLSNLETETEKLLQIVLVGQPELRALLARADLAQLNQRITVRWHLLPLDRDETAVYVRHRLRIAGGPQAADLLTPAALRVIYRYSRGVPRLINIAAHRALLAGFTREERPIGAALTRRAVRELEASAARPTTPARLLLPALGAAVAAILLALLAAFAVLQPPATGATSGLPPPALDTAPASVALDAPAPDPAIPVRDEPALVAEPLAAIDGEGVTPAVMPTPTVGAAAVNAAGPDAFWQALTALDHQTIALAAADDLLALWEAAPLAADERAQPRLDLAAVAARRGLGYLPADGNLARLETLNLPAVLELSVPPAGRRRFAVLTRLADGTAALRLGSLEATLDATALGRVWLGEAHVFWRDFEALPAYFALGDSGAEVAALQQLLARSGALATPPSTQYDETIMEAIARFQRSHRLVPDGIVGPLTKIVLYDAVGGYPSPRLDRER